MLGYLVYTNLTGTEGRNSILIYNNGILEETHFHNIGGGKKHNTETVLSSYLLTQEA